MGKYLIVEDNLDKFKEVKNELLKGKVSNYHIEHVVSVNEATKLLKSNIYSMVILDLNLPMTKNGNPVENGGITLLSKLKGNPSKYNLPQQIIGLTSYEYLKKEQSSEFESLCFSLYDFELSDWKDALQNKIAWDLSSNTSKPRVPGKNVVFSVHGIRTLGHWQDKLERSVTSYNEEPLIEKYRYNYFSAIQLLFPRYRDIVINDLADKIEKLTEKYPDSKFVIFSHSFGTYAIVKALDKLPVSCDLKVDKLFLVSSVMKSDYCFEQMIKRFSINKIYNECGYNDNVLLLSHYTCIDMGMAGRNGFIGTSVINRFYKGGHDFFNRDDGFIDKFWLPAIFENEGKQYDERKFSSLRENIEILLYTRHIPVLLVVFLSILTIYLLV
ncbi:hypothetical protein C4G95_RS16000 [Vibrio parahaemolyticus]|nr:hypothetical protein [Vibrio parahaemolyticus]